MMCQPIENLVDSVTVRNHPQRTWWTDWIGGDCDCGGASYCILVVGLHSSDTILLPKTNKYSHDHVPILYHNCAVVGLCQLSKTPAQKIATTQNQFQSVHHSWGMSSSCHLSLVIIGMLSVLSPYFY